MARKMKPTFYVTETDDCGTRILVEGAASPESAAKRAARLNPDVDATELAATWNYFTDGGTSYAIGERS